MQTQIPSGAPSPAARSTSLPVVETIGVPMPLVELTHHPVIMDDNVLFLEWAYLLFV
jgi:hypothetical protein